MFFDIVFLIWYWSFETNYTVTVFVSTYTFLSSVSTHTHTHTLQVSFWTHVNTVLTRISGQFVDAYISTYTHTHTHFKYSFQHTHIFQHFEKMIQTYIILTNNIPNPRPLHGYRPPPARAAVLLRQNESQTSLKRQKTFVVHSVRNLRKRYQFWTSAESDDWRQQIWQAKMLLCGSGEKCGRGVLQLFWELGRYDLIFNLKYLFDFKLIPI